MEIVNKYFKFILFFVPLFFIFTTIGHAESSVNISYDFDNNTDFNLFYEYRNSTTLAKFLAEKGSDLLSYLITLDSTNSNSLINMYSKYAIWLDRADSSDIANYSNAYYKINLTFVANGYQCTTHYYFAQDLTFISCFANASLMVSDNSFNLDFNSHPEFYFNYYEGTLEYYNSLPRTLILHNIRIDNKDYYLAQDNQNYFQTIADFYTHLLFTGHDYNDSYGINLDYYKTNAVIGSNIPLKPIHDTLFGNNSINVDMNKYGKILVNQYSDGVYLEPITSNYDSNTMDVNFLYYTTNVKSFLKGGLVTFKSDGSLDTNVNMVLNNSLNPYNLIKFNFGAYFGSNLRSNWYQYAYYFKTDETAYDLFLYYDKNTYKPVYINSNNSVSLTDPVTGIVSTISSNDNVVSSMNNTINTNGYVSNSTGSYLDTLKSNSSSSATDVKADVSSITTYIGNSFTGIGSAVKFLFSSFPEISNLLVFGFSALVVIGILKAIF
jgi:hypothetical protein